jgi:anti-sigma-K factor RskA
MMEHSQAIDLLADFAIDLLEPEEAAAVRAHVESCADCRAELQVYLQAGDALAIGVEPVELGGGVPERIAAGVRARVTAAPAAPRPPLQVVARTDVVPRQWRTMALASAAAVLVLAVGLAVSVNGWIGAQDDADRLEQELQARALELPLSGEGAQGTIYVSSDFKSGVARFTGLPPAPAEHHYQVWSEGPFGERSATDFLGQEGDLLVELPELPNDMTRMFVTIEPDGASGDRPTGPEVLSTPK